MSPDFPGKWPFTDWSLLGPIGHSGHLEAEAEDTKMDRATRSCGKRIYPLVMSK